MKKKLSLSRQRLFLMLLALITLVGGVFRSFQLDQYPPILNRDEAALAYNAFSLLKTGQDEWGKEWPVQFQSFGDYKLGGYVYLLWGLFHILPITDLTVRLPAAIAGTALIPLTALFVLHLTNRKKIALLAALFLAISPFAIFYSRMAWEANVGLSWLMVSLVILSRPKRSNTVWSWSLDVVGIDFYLLACLTYNTPLLLAPVIIPVVFLLNQKFSLTRAVANSVLILLVALFVGLQLWQVSAQKGSITIFQHPTILNEYPEYRHSFPAALQTLLGNKYVYYFQEMAQRWVATYAPEFLVFRGGTHPWHTVLGKGHIYISVYVLAVISVIFAIAELVKWASKKKSKKTNPFPVSSGLLLFLLMFSSLPAVITFDAPHATRSLLTFVVVCVLAAVGTERLLRWKKIRGSETLLLVAIGMSVLVETGIYLKRYFVEWPQAGFTSEFNLSLASQIAATPPEEPVSVVDESGYIYVVIAWYEKTEPQTFLQTVERTEPDLAGLYAVKRFDRYSFIHPSVVPEISGNLVQWNGREWVFTTQ